MNHETAIDIIINHCSSEQSAQLRDALELAIESLQKQIPTPPIVKNWSPAFCPNCKAELSESVGDGYYKHHVSLKHCECGQRLDWKGVY